MTVETSTAWRAGIYARLSVANDERKNESIDTQIEIAKEYIKRSGDIELVDCYVDLGKTGTNFDREGFEQMMQDVRRKRINCVIVKDFSRFGRNYIETGTYIEKIFPFMKVRFIAVTDDFDSECATDENARLSMNLKNIVNELYAKDIAERAKIAKRTRQEMGNYTGGAPPYGYDSKYVGDKRVLFPQTETKDIVVKIFEMYGQGCTYKEIREYLYKKRIQRPKVYYATKKVYCTEDETLQQWSDGSIKHILNNPCYIGDLFQACTGGKHIEACKQDENYEDVTIIVEHAHEPIVSEDLYYQVAQRFEKQSRYSNSKGFSKIVPQSEDVFAGVIYCGECGKWMRRTFSTKTLANGNIVRNYYYFCLKRDRVDGNACQCERISQKTLVTMVKSILEKEFSFSKMRPKHYCQENENEAEKKKTYIKHLMAETVKRQEALILKGSKMYLQYKQGDLSQEKFIEEKCKVDKEKVAQCKRLAELEMEEKQIEKEAEKRNRFIRALMKYKKNVELDRMLVESLITQICVYSGRRIEIAFNYRKNELLSWGKNDE